VVGNFGPGYGGESFSAPSTGPSWTQAIAVTGNASGANATAVWYRFYTTGDPITYNFGAAIADYVSGYILPVAGASTGAPLSCASSFNDTASTTATWPSVTPTLANSLDILTAAVNNGSDTFTTPSGFSPLVTINPSFHAGAVFIKGNPALSALTPSTTVSTSDTNALTQCVVNP
jgi:hypothetical protein